MGLQKLKGKFGDYYTNTFNSSQGLNKEQQELNAKYIYYYLKNEGWTINAISGLLGNTSLESTNNPGRWQGDNVGVGPAYGLVQWDPFSKYINWIGANNHPEYMDNNLSRIIWEKNNNQQWISTSLYPLSFDAFTKSDKTPEYLASAWLKNYERAGVEVEDARRNKAKEWYNFLEKLEPYHPTETTKKKKNFKWVLFTKNIRIKRT